MRACDALVRCAVLGSVHDDDEDSDDDINDDEYLHIVGHNAYACSTLSGRNVYVHVRDACSISRIRKLGRPPLNSALYLKGGLSSLGKIRVNPYRRTPL